MSIRWCRPWGCVSHAPVQHGVELPASPLCHHLCPQSHKHYGSLLHNAGRCVQWTAYATRGLAVIRTQQATMQGYTVNTTSSQSSSGKLASTHLLEFFGVHEPRKTAHQQHLVAHRLRLPHNNLGSRSACISSATVHQVRHTHGTAGLKIPQAWQGDTDGSAQGAGICMPVAACSLQATL
jgi:hypothetical protein